MTAARARCAPRWLPASSGDVINFAAGVTTIDLDSSLVITKNVTIEGAQPGSTTPGVTINGGGSSHAFTDFVVDAGVTATFDGLIIADGDAKGAAGADYVGNYGTSGSGGAAAGGIYVKGDLTLTNTFLENDTATGGAGGTGADGLGVGGGAGGSAAGASMSRTAAASTLRRTMFSPAIRPPAAREVMAVKA